MTTTPTAVGVDSVSQSQPGYDGERAASVGAEPSAAQKLARTLVLSVRRGELDPRKAAQHLGLAFDQDAIMSILEAAAAGPEIPPTQPVPAAKSESHNHSEGEDR